MAKVHAQMNASNYLTKSITAVLKEILHGMNEAVLVKSCSYKALNERNVAFICKKKIILNVWTIEIILKPSMVLIY